MNRVNLLDLSDVEKCQTKVLLKIGLLNEENMMCYPDEELTSYIRHSIAKNGGKLSSLRAVAVPSAECKPIALKLPKFTIVNEHDTGSPNQHRDSISTNETMSTTSSCTGSPHATPEKSKSPRKLSGNNTTHEKIKPRELSANNKSPETSIALRKRGVACGNVACEKMYDKWSEDSTRSSTQGHKMHTL